MFQLASEIGEPFAGFVKFGFKFRLTPTVFRKVTALVTPVALTVLSGRAAETAAAHGVRSAWIVTVYCLPSLESMARSSWTQLAHDL